MDAQQYTDVPQGYKVLPPAPPPPAFSDVPEGYKVLPPGPTKAQSSAQINQISQPQGPGIAALPSAPAIPSIGTAPRSIAEGLTTEQQERRGGMPLTLRPAQPATGGLNPQPATPERLTPVGLPTQRLSAPAQSTAVVREPAAVPVPVGPKFTNPGKATPQEAAADIENLKTITGERGYREMAENFEKLVPTATQRTPTAKQAEVAATGVLKGATTAATPLMVVGSVLQPEAAIMAAGGAYAGGKGAKKLAEVVHASPEVQDLVEQAGQIAGGFAGGAAYGGLKHLANPENALTDLLWKKGYIQDNEGKPIYIHSQEQARAVAQEIIRQNPQGVVGSYLTKRAAARAAENVPAREYMGVAEPAPPLPQLPAYSDVPEGYKVPPEPKPDHHGGSSNSNIHDDTDDVEDLRASAERQAPKVGDAVKEATEGVPGAKLEAVRDAKDTDRIEDKAARQGVTPSQVGDISAAKVTAPDQASAGKVLENLNQTLPVTDASGSVTGEPGNNAVRQVQAHVDTQAPAGEPVKKAEVLIQTPEMHAATEETHEDYRKAQELRAAGKDAEAAALEAKITERHNAAEQEARARQEGSHVQEPSTGSVLQRPPEETGVAGRGRGRVEPGQQGQEVAASIGAQSPKAPVPPISHQDLTNQRVEIRDPQTGEWKPGTVLADTMRNPTGGNNGLRRLRGTFDDGGKFNDLKVSDVRRPSAAKATVGVDFDGTLFKENADGSIGEPIPERIASLKQDVAAGKNIVIESRRAKYPGEIENIHRALESVGLPRLPVTEKKTAAPELIGDKEPAERGVKVDEVATNANTPLPEKPFALNEHEKEISKPYGPPKAEHGGVVPPENLGFNHQIETGPDLGQKVRNENPEPTRAEVAAAAAKPTQISEAAKPERDTDIMARLEKEHPEWSLSRRLQEAAAIANPAGGKSLASKTEEGTQPKPSVGGETGVAKAEDQQKGTPATTAGAGGSETAPEAEKGIDLFAGAEPVKAPIFYSKAEKIADQKVSTGSGSSVLATLKNGGVKEDEIKWLGLDDFLKDKPRVTKAELQEYIRANSLQIQEVALDQKQYPEKPTWDGVGGLVNNRRGVKYEQYTLPGEKQNYTELLLQLPLEPAGGNPYSKIVALEEKLADAESERTKYLQTLRPVPGDVELRFHDAQTALRKAHNELDNLKPFKSSHFDEPNIVAHVRFDGRTDADGKKVLFVEEVQSDWHQKGKKIGYHDPKAAEESDRLKKVASEKRAALAPLLKQADDLGYDTSTEILNDIARGSYPPEHIDESGVPGLRAAAEAYREAHAAWQKVQTRSISGVPDAPFKTDWHELAMKRMLRAAAENGYDKLAWVTGEQTADRYDLAKHVDEIRAARAADNNKFSITGYKLNSAIFKKFDVEEKDLPDFVGKDLATKIATLAPGKHGNYSGLDLKTGGTWAKALYDRAIPNFINKVGKKWGVKTGETKITAANTRNLRVQERTTSTIEGQVRNYAVYDGDGKEHGAFKTIQEAKAKIDELREGESVHSIDVTPEMKKSVMEEGQPLFRQPQRPITAGVARGIDFNVVPTKAGLPSYIRVNPHAVAAISNSLGTSFLGVNLDKPSTVKVVKDLRFAAENADKMGIPDAARKLSGFADALEEALDKNQKEGVSLVREGAGELETAHEELLHAIQRRAGGGDIGAGVPWKNALRDPVIAGMAADLADDFMHNGIAPDPAALVAEAMVDLLRGDATHLTPEGVAQAADHYFESAAQQHGIEHLEDLQAVQDYIAGREEALNVTHNAEVLAVRRAGEEALARAIARRSGDQTGPTGEALPGEPIEKSGTANPATGAANSGPPNDAGLGRKRPASAPQKPAFSTQPVGLSDEELEQWSKSKGFRYEPAGEQLGMFGGNDPLLRVFRQGPRGREQRALIYQNQLDRLQEGKPEPTEPFQLTGGEAREEQPALFGAGDLGEIVGNPKAENGIKLPSKGENTSLFSKPVKQEPSKPENLLSGELGTFTPAKLNPAHIKQAYENAVEEFISGKLKIGDKYYDVAKHDETVANTLHLVDNAPRYFKAKADANLNKVTAGLSEDQIRLASMMVDSDSRDYLQAEKPDEYKAAKDDPAVMAAVDKFKPLQEELTKDRMALGWPVRRSLEVSDELPDGGFHVIDRDGTPVKDDKGEDKVFKTEKSAAKFVMENGTIEPHLKRTYPEHSRSPLPAETGVGEFTGSYVHDKGLRPPKMDKKSREMSAAYHYEHGRKDFSGYVESFKQTKTAVLKQQLFDEFTDSATKWTAGTAQPSKIEYNGKTYYSPDVAAKAKKGGEKLEPYAIYDPTRGEKFLVANPEEGWAVLQTGKPGIKASDRFLGPKQVVDAMENYDVTRGGEASKLRHWFQEQIVGLFGPVVHINNILRHVGHATGLGTFDPRSWPSIARVLASPDLRARVLKGVDDATIDMLTKQGAYTDWGDIGTLNRYIGGNLNPASWIRAFGKGVLFDPKFAKGWGGLDPKARVVVADYFKDHYPNMTEAQVSKAVEDAFGNYNRANWTERQRLLAKFSLFPGWDVASFKWFLRHPFKVGVAGSLVVLAINLALRALGKNKGDDSTDLSYVHIGDRKLSSGLISDNMGNHMMAPVIGALQAKLHGEDVGAGAVEGAMKGTSALAGTLAGPIVEMVADEVYNRKYAGASTELVKPNDRYLPGTWAPNVELEKRIAFAALKGAPALNRFIDNQGHWDWAQGLGGAVLGVTNYKYGAEERFKANLGKAAAYGETLNQLAQTNPEAASSFVRDPVKATYLMFHDDLEQMNRDLKEIDSQIERVRGADISATERQQALADLKDSRNELLKAADGLNDALTEAKSQARKDQANYWSQQQKTAP